MGNALYSGLIDVSFFAIFVSIDMNKSVYIKTWGCQMNFHQSEGIAGVLERAGFRITNSLTDADVILFNTCMVRQKAEEKVFGQLGNVEQLKSQKRVLFGIGGCIAQARGESLLRRFPVVDFLFGVAGLDNLPRLLLEVEEKGKRIAHLPSPYAIDEIPFRREGSIKAMVNITKGCSNSCSYCIVPHSRGPLHSREPEKILAEVRALADSGYKEVLLLGQNVDSYGRDRTEYGEFAELLAQVADVGIPRVRFTTSHPRDMTERVIQTIAEHESICNHIHLACQSGSDRVLSLMNRGYTRSDFLSIVNKARILVRGINITTDLIVGHPGETEGDFRATLELLDEGRFGAVFVAEYSPRPGTRSTRLADDVPIEAKNERLQEILIRQREITLEENHKRIGDRIEVLVDGRNRKGMSYGRSDDHRMVILDREVGAGTFVLAHIEAASAASLTGRVLMSAVTRGAS